MNLRHVFSVLIALAPVSAVAQPAVDHHQHLFSASLAKVINVTPITAADLIKHLDDAGIKRVGGISQATADRS